MLKKQQIVIEKGNEFYLTNEQVKEALTDSILFKNSKSIPTNRFAEDEITVFAFGKTAENYGKFLEQANIKKISIYLANFKKKSFARQVWLHRLDDVYGFGLLGRGDLDCYNAVRGVQNVEPRSGETKAEKTLENSILKLRAESERQILEIKERAKKAENYLRTGKF